MSCGAPVMMWINRTAFEHQGFPAPPVINAHTEEDIRKALEEIRGGSLDLEVQGRVLSDWFSRHFGYEHAIPRLKRLIEENMQCKAGDRSSPCIPIPTVMRQ